MLTTIVGVSSSSLSSPPLLVLPTGPSWEPFLSNICGPGRGGVWRGGEWLGGSKNLSVRINFATSTSLESYGNVVTCNSGYRLHAFRAVRDGSPTTTAFRNVILERGEVMQKEKES